MKKKHKLHKHHRKPTSIGGTDDPHNISFVPYNQHNAWHLLFSNMTAQTICAIINEKWLNPEYEFVCRRRNEGN